LDRELAPALHEPEFATSWDECGIQPFPSDDIALRASSAAHAAGLQAMPEALELADEPQQVNQVGKAE
jgi:hypothetical protein